MDVEVQNRQNGVRIALLAVALDRRADFWLSKHEVGEII